MSTLLQPIKKSHWSSCEEPVLSKEASSYRVSVGTRVKIEAKENIFWTSLHDDTAVFFDETLVPKREIIVAESYKQVRVTLLSSGETFLYSLPRAARPLYGNILKKGYQFFGPSFGLHLSLVLVVVLVSLSPTILNWVGSLAGSEKLADSDQVLDFKSSTGSVAEERATRVPREQWFKGLSYSSFLRSQSTSASNVSRFADQFRKQGGLFSGGSNGAQLGSGFSLQKFKVNTKNSVSVQELLAQNPEVPEKKMPAKQVSLTPEQQSRIKGKFDSVEPKLVAAFELVKKMDSQFMASIRYDGKIDSRGYFVPVSVLIEGAGSADHKSIFKTEITKILTTVAVGSDVAGVTIRGGKVFIN